MPEIWEQIDWGGTGSKPSASIPQFKFASSKIQSLRELARQGRRYLEKQARDAPESIPIVYTQPSLSPKHLNTELDDCGQDQRARNSFNQEVPTQREFVTTTGTPDGTEPVVTNTAEAFVTSGPESVPKNAT